VVLERMVFVFSGTLGSGGHGGQPRDGIIAQRSNDLQRHATAALDDPFEERGADMDDRVVVGEDCALAVRPLITVELFERICGVDFTRWSLGKVTTASTSSFSAYSEYTMTC